MKKYSFATEVRKLVPGEKATLVGTWLAGLFRVTRIVLASEIAKDLRIEEIRLGEKLVAEANGMNGTRLSECDAGLSDVLAIEPYVVSEFKIVQITCTNVCQMNIHAIFLIVGYAEQSNS